MIDAASSFSSGQVYVALSRCTSLNGIVLLSKIPSSAIYSNEQVVAAHTSLVPKGSLAERFQGARLVFTLQLLSEVFLINDLIRLCNWLKSLIEKNAEKLNADAHAWVVAFTEQLKKEHAFAEKFINRIPDFLQQQAVIENNQPLQKRIQDAANYFLPLLQQQKEQLQKHPLVTEHKETATIIDECLQELLSAFVVKIYFIQHCQQPFTIAGFLKHKLNLAIPRQHISSYAANKKTASLSDIPNAELFLSLKSWRDRICNETNTPIFMVASNTSLREISTFLPLNKQHLQQLSGFGTAKAEKYGEDILAMVHEYCDRHHLETNIELKATSPKKQRKETSKKKEDKVPSAVISLQSFKEGKSITEIAKERNLAVSTIEAHLTNFIKTGEIKIDQFADAVTVSIITEYINTNPEKSHTEIRSMLKDAYSFTQIRAVANHLVYLQQKNTATGIMQ